MKAITIWQPWASLIILGEKEYETRHWPTNHRGQLAIHAGKRNELEGIENLPPDNFVRRAFEKHQINWRELPSGVVLGVVNLVDCIETDLMKPTEQEGVFGDFTPGRFAWRMDGIARFDEPIPARGAQGFWDWQARR